jgi:uncharacterized membrane protein
MSHDPAAIVARAKAEHPMWTIHEVRPGKGWTAKHRDTRATVYADTLAEIDSRTRDADRSSLAAGANTPTMR